jgi:hypothetical protein
VPTGLVSGGAVCSVVCLGQWHHLIRKMLQEHYNVRTPSVAGAPLFVSEGPQFLLLYHEASTPDDTQGEVQDGLEKMDG